MLNKIIQQPSSMCIYIWARLFACSDQQYCVSLDCDLKDEYSGATAQTERSLTTTQKSRRSSSYSQRSKEVIIVPPLYVGLMFSL